MVSSLKKYVCAKFRLYWLLCESHLYPYCNVWPEVVFHCLELEVAITSPSFVSPRLLVFEIYYLRLFINNYIVYYDVYCYYCGVFIEKYVYAKFRCVSEIHSHLCPYIEMCGLRVFIVVLQELHCLPYMFV